MTNINKFLEFFECNEQEDEWSGMRSLGHPIKFYLNYSAGHLRNRYGCVIPSYIPDEATISQSSSDLFYFSWYEGDKWCYSRKIEL